MSIHERIAEYAARHADRDDFWRVVHERTHFARIIAPDGAVRLAPVPDGFPFADMTRGQCGGCAGSGRRDFPMPARHPRRIADIPARACHDCRGTGAAHVHESSVIARALDAARGDETR